jgi:hypothetical protein
MARAAGTIRKKTGEKFPIGFRYQAPDLPAGVTISSVVVTVVPAANLTLGTNGVIADGTEVYCWLTGGTDLIDYTVKFTSTLSDTKILIDDYMVRCRN